MATWLGSLATPLPNLAGGQRRPGDLRSRALARASGRACRPGQGSQPPGGHGILLHLRWLGEGHELPKGQEGHTRGHKATERRHPAINGRHQPVQQKAKTQPTPADTPRRSPKTVMQLSIAGLALSSDSGCSVGCPGGHPVGSILDASAPSRGSRAANSRLVQMRHERVCTIHPARGDLTGEPGHTSASPPVAGHTPVRAAARCLPPAPRLRVGCRSGARRPWESAAGRGSPQSSPWSAKLKEAVVPSPITT